jgi:hypothetical protein
MSISHRRANRIDHEWRPVERGDLDRIVLAGVGRRE